MFSLPLSICHQPALPLPPPQPSHSALASSAQPSPCYRGPHYPWPIVQKESIAGKCKNSMVLSHIKILLQSKFDKHIEFFCLSERGVNKCLPDPRGAGLHQGFKFFLRSFVLSFVRLHYAQKTPTWPLYIGPLIFLQILNLL